MRALKFEFGAAVALAASLAVSPAQAQAQRAPQPSPPSRVAIPAPAATATPSRTGAELPGVTRPPGASHAAGNRLDAPAAASGYAPMPSDARVSFNLHDVDLPELVRAVSDLTGRRFIVGGRVRSIHVSIYSPTRVTVAEAYQAFLAALDANGLTVVPANGYALIEETAGILTRPLAVQADADTTPDDAEWVTRVHRLRAMNANAAAQFLSHFRSRDGDVTPTPTDNAIVLTDTGTSIRRMLRLLAEIDVPGAAHAPRGGARPPAAPANGTRGGGPRSP